MKAKSALSPGRKSQVIYKKIDELPEAFTLATLCRECLDVSRDLIRLRLNHLRKYGYVECTGRGPGARWRGIRPIIRRLAGEATPRAGTAPEGVTDPLDDLAPGDRAVQLLRQLMAVMPGYETWDLATQDQADRAMIRWWVAAPGAWCTYAFRLSMPRSGPYFSAIATEEEMAECYEYAGLGVFRRTST